uniref:DUF2197 domain-containing protein n=1 Tax=Halalkalibacterium halodurans TaxID=86665 RepID=A0A0M0KJM0_ALKHA
MITVRVKCVLCERIDLLDDDLPLAKKLRNRPIHTYMCDECKERITKKTNKNRKQTTYDCES